MNTTRKSYPSEVSDGEWELLLPYLTLMRDDAPRRAHALRELFDAIRFVVRTGCVWRFLLHDFPPSTAVDQQARRSVQAGVFEHITHALRAIARFLSDRNLELSAAILMDSHFNGRRREGTVQVMTATKRRRVEDTRGSRYAGKSVGLGDHTGERAGAGTGIGTGEENSGGYRQ